MELDRKLFPEFITIMLSNFRQGSISFCTVKSGHKFLRLLGRCQ